MIIFASITIGMMIIGISMSLIRKEVMKASFFKHVKVNALDTSDNRLVMEQIQKLENIVDEMNQSFYDITSDLEGKFSVHEKEISLLENQLESLTNQFKTLNDTLYYQGKAINRIKPEEERVQNRLTDHKNNMTKTQEALKEEVMKLKALGYDDAQIAKSLKKGITEIKMLMDLAK
ncbi:MAG: hypothetical protein JXR88_16490 [Clostridia bacterium]|nr:hypothetical protein [Clostridia bacterium]